MEENKVEETVLPVEEKVEDIEESAVVPEVVTPEETPVVEEVVV